MLTKIYSKEEGQILKQVWDNVTLVDDENGNKVKYIYQNDPEITFHSKNNNFQINLRPPAKVKKITKTKK